MKPIILSKHMIMVVIALCITTNAFTATYNHTIQPREKDAYEKAHYRLWLPDDIKTVRGIIFRQHGCGPGARKLGLEHADDIQWQALAAKHDCALMSSQMWAPQEDCSTWTMPADGSAHAFLSAIEHFAKATKHPELKHVPWAIWGHSGGAIWVTNMAYSHPKRIIGVFARSGGLTPQGRTYTRSQPAKPDSNADVFKVPILFCYGEREHVSGNRFFKLIEGVYDVYDVGRAVKHNAPWAVAIHPDSEHENSNSRLLAIRYFDALLKLRLSEAAAVKAATQPIEPKPIKRSDGLLTDARNVRAFPEFALDSVSPANFGWLPNKTVAEAWVEFTKTGSINDTTPPPAPTDVTLTESESGITLKWRARADVESGIAAFNIYRDSRRIGRVQGTVVKRWNPKGHYHAWNYSDQPLQGTKLPAMQFEDDSDKRSIKAKYAVTTVNQAGLESKRATATTR